MSSLEVCQLCFDYGRGPVLQDISFSVEKGRVCGLLGPNGSGKTTLFKCINHLLAPQNGHVNVLGRPISDFSRRQLAGLMAVVPQQTGSAFSFNSLEMVVMAKAASLSMWQKPSKEDYLNAENILEELGVGSLKHQLFNALSGGEKQIVLLARAMFQAPSILLLDEPTAHLDFRNQHLILEMIRSVSKKKGLTSVMSLHDPNLAARYCDHLVMLRQGRIYKEGPAAKIFNEGTLEAVFDLKVSITDLNHGNYLVTPRTDNSEFMKNKSSVGIEMMML